MDKMNKENTIWSKLAKYAAPGTLGILMIYAAVSSGQSSGSEINVQSPEFETLSSAAISNPYSPELKDVFFNPGSHLIREDAKPVLDENAEVLIGEPGTFVVIEAYCDAREESTPELGAKRADSVKEYILEQGVDAERVITANKCNIYDMQLVKSMDSERLDSRVRFIALDQISEDMSYAVK